MTKHKLLLFLLLLVGMAQGTIAREAYAVLSSDGQTVTFYYDTQKANRTGVVEINKSEIYTSYGESNAYGSATTAVIDASFVDYRPTSTAYWFNQCTRLTSILDMVNLNTSNVTDMGSMFYGCSSLALLDLSNFNTSKVTDMGSMFYHCSSLSSLDLRNFNTDNVTDMRYMFFGCSSLTSLNLSNFNTSNLTDMGYMFSGCSSLTSLDISNFNTSNVIDMYYIFEGCSSLTSLDLSNFNTSNVPDVSWMFGGCSSLTSLDVSNFNTSKVTNMAGMFSGCSSLASLDVSKFNTSNVTDMDCMFSDCNSLTSLEISNFNTSKVTNMAGMFSGCSSLASLDVSKFNTSNVTDMDCMFYDCNSLTSLDVCNFKTSNVMYMSSMFDGCVKLKTIFADEGWNSRTVKSSMDMFYNCIELLGSAGTSYDSRHTDAAYARIDGGTDTPGYFTDKNVSPIANAEPYAVLTDDGQTVTFYYDTEKRRRIGRIVKINQLRADMYYGINAYCTAMSAVIDASFVDYHPRSTAGWFYGCEKMTSVLGMECLNTSNVTDMGSMFYGCSSLTSLDLSNFNTSKVTDMESMFYHCSSLSSLDLSNFNTVSAVKMNGMFRNCSSLTSLDVSNFNTDNVTDMRYMFFGCSSLTSLNLSNLNTSNVKNMIHMFQGCRSLSSLDISNFNTDKVTNMGLMFADCGSLTSLDVSNFNTSNVTGMGSMFFGCSSLESICVGEGWTTDAVTNGSAMFENCTALVGGAGTAYDANHTDAAYARIDGGTDAPGYFTGKNVPVDNVTLTAKNYTREYGEDNPAFEYEVTEGTITSGTPEITCEATASSMVGTYDIIISKGTVSNNGTVELVKGTLTITKAPLTISCGNYTIMQGEALPEFALEYNGWKNDETEDVLTTKPTVTCEASKDSEPGTYDIIVNGAEAQNYEISYVAGKLTVTARKDNVTLTAKSYTREYGEANPAFEYDVTEGTITNGTPELSSEATVTSPVGTYDIVISKGSVTNNEVSLVNGTLTITKAPLTISCGDYTITQGEALPEFALEYSGWKNNETVDVLTTKPTVTCEATSNSEPGTYDIIVSSAEAENYEISYVSGTLTIEAKPIVIEPVEVETEMKTEELSGQDLSNNVVNDVYYNTGENSYDSSDGSIVISQTTNMAQIADKEPGSKDVKENFNGMILKVAKGKGLITVNVKTSGNAQLVVQVGNGTPMLASKTEKGDVVFRYDVEEDTYVYIYAIIGSSAAKGYGLSAADTDSSVRIYSITVSPGATGIRSIGASERNDGNIYDLQGHRVETPAKGIYIIGGRKVAVK